MRRRRARLAASSTSEATPPENITLAEIVGSTFVNRTLTVSPGEWTEEPELTSEWRRDGIAIPGATGLTYVCAVDDVGAMIDVLEIPNGDLDAAVAADAVGPVAYAQNMTFQVTTTGAAQTLTLNEVRTAIGETINVNWGDSSNNSYTSTVSTGNQRTHQYATAGTYTITIDRPHRVTHFDVRDTKLSSLPGAQLWKMVNLENLRLLTFPNTVLSWTVSADAPMPHTIQYLQLELHNNFVWAVDGDLPPINDVLNLRGLPNMTWLINDENPMPVPAESITVRDSTGITYVSSMEDVPDVDVVRIENGWNQAQADAFLRDLYAAFPTRTKTGGTVDLLGSNNAAPSGTLAAMCPPTTGKAYAYELVNDSCGVSSNHWTIVTTG